MAKKVKTNKTFKQIGEALKAAWIAGDSTREIDCNRLLEMLELEAEASTEVKKGVVFDIITDQDIDDETRMVWICIPSPDTKGSWADYADKFETDEDLEDLGKAVLFGCGR
ncbi:MAG: hypothetical protein V2I76_03110 [Roseobacter sp.]|jgi:hypothetical protein|nr:hypothetical protein [Roseobacter sp.]